MAPGADALVEATGEPLVASASDWSYGVEVAAHQELRDRYVDELRRDGVVLDAALAHAFGSVPRDIFLADGFQRSDGSWAASGDDDFLTTVYRNSVLVTKLRDGVPVSSSSQPSLMALMLSALAVRPGMRVLEIGAGTGYNAALLAAMGAEVTSVDVQPDVARRAESAISRAGVVGVRVVLGDGYLGDPAGAPYDRVIVTVGVTGVSPHWLDQLTDGGLILAPIAHAGINPVLAMRVTAGNGTPVVRGSGICAAGFMTAAGALAARLPGAHPQPARRRRPLIAADAAVTVPARWVPPLGLSRYHDLWFAAGAWDRRASSVLVEAPELASGCALLDGSAAAGVGNGAGLGGGGAAGVADGTSAQIDTVAVLLPDGGVRADGPRAEAAAADAVALIDRWQVAGGPAITDWTGDFAPIGDPDQPIWAPIRWSHSQQAASRPS